MGVGGLTRCRWLVAKRGIVGSMFHSAAIAFARSKSSSQTKSSFRSSLRTLITTSDSLAASIKSTCLPCSMFDNATVFERGDGDALAAQRAILKSNCRL